MAMAICGEADSCIGDPAKYDFRQGAIQSTALDLPDPDGHERDSRIAWLAPLLAYSVVEPSLLSILVLGAPVASQTWSAASLQHVPCRFENHFAFSLRKILRFE
jgi:hypothetical protein